MEKSSEHKKNRDVLNEIIVILKSVEADIQLLKNEIHYIKNTYIVKEKVKRDLEREDEITGWRFF